MKMRMLMYGQVAWLIFVATLARGWMTIPDSVVSVLQSFPRLCGVTLDGWLAVLPAYLFPVLVIVVARRVPFARRRMTLVIVVEVLFFVTWMVALLPAVQ